MEKGRYRWTWGVVTKPRPAYVVFRTSAPPDTPMPEYPNRICTCQFARDAMQIADALNRVEVEERPRTPNGS